MPDNTPVNGVEEKPAIVVPASDAAPAATPEVVPAVEEKVEAPKAALSENALESSHADALPLSQIGGEEKPTTATAKTKNKGHRGLHRGSNGPKFNAQSAQPGLVDNSSEVKETLSGNGPKPRRQRQPRVPAAMVDKNIEQARESGNWRVEDPVSETPRKFHPQSNIVDSNGKLHIEPAALPVQEKEPSFFSKLWSKVCKLFGVKQKKHGKKNGKKFDGKKRYYGNNKYRKNTYRKGGYNKKFRRRGGNFQKKD